MRPITAINVRYKRSFNPRICKRCDGLTTYESRVINVSIHASVKDATLAVMYGYSLCPVSIHASVKDATGASGLVDSNVAVSIHASVKDATGKENLGLKTISSFNPRICKRCDSMFVKSFIDDTFKL